MLSREMHLPGGFIFFIFYLLFQEMPSVALVIYKTDSPHHSHNLSQIYHKKLVNTKLTNWWNIYVILQG